MADTKIGGAYFELGARLDQLKKDLASATGMVDNLTKKQRTIKLAASGESSAMKQWATDEQRNAGFIPRLGRATGYRIKKEEEFAEEVGKSLSNAMALLGAMNKGASSSVGTINNIIGAAGSISAAGNAASKSAKGAADAAEESWSNLDIATGAGLAALLKKGGKGGLKAFGKAFGMIAATMEAIDFAGASLEESSAFDQSQRNLSLQAAKTGENYQSAASSADNLRESLLEIAPITRTQAYDWAALGRQFGLTKKEIVDVGRAAMGLGRGDAATSMQAFHDLAKFRLEPTDLSKYGVMVSPGAPTSVQFEQAMKQGAMQAEQIKAEETSVQRFKKNMTKIKTVQSWVGNVLYGIANAPFDALSAVGEIGGSLFSEDQLKYPSGSRTDPKTGVVYTPENIMEKIKRESSISGSSGAGVGSFTEQSHDQMMQSGAIASGLYDGWNTGQNPTTFNTEKKLTEIVDQLKILNEKINGTSGGPKPAMEFNKTGKPVFGKDFH